MIAPYVRWHNGTELLTPPKPKDLKRKFHQILLEAPVSGEVFSTLSDFIESLGTKKKSTKKTILFEDLFIVGFMSFFKLRT